MNAQYIVPPTPPATNGTYTGRSFLSVTPAGVNAFVIYYIVVKNNAKPVASLTEVGVWPLFIPLNPCFLNICTAASNDPEYTLSAAPLWIWILIRVCSIGAL